MEKYYTDIIHSLEELEDDSDDFDYCYECTGYGDDYSVDSEGNFVSNCDNCPFNALREED